MTVRDCRQQPAVFCLPHAGGSAASAYHAWRGELGERIRVMPLELAGRGRRVGDPPYADLRAAAIDCVERIGDLADGAPFALFGHSIGGLLAYEIDAVLRQTGGRRPAAVAIAGTPAPNRTFAEEPVHALPDGPFLDAVARFGGLPQAVLDHPAAREFHLEILRGDFRLVERYQLASPAHRLEAPLLVMQATRDVVTAPQDPAQWSLLATGCPRVWLCETDDHFFVASQRSEALTALRAFVTRALV